MKSQQLNRMLQQICSMMKISQPATQTTIHYFKLFRQSQTHQFPHQIIIASCIFLVSKVFQENRKIRDILNIIYIGTSLYKKAQQITQKERYWQLEEVIEKYPLSVFLPHYKLEEYNHFKGMIMDAEQHLLRIINFDVSLADINSSKFKQLLLVLKTIQSTKWFSQTAVSVYNDLAFSDLQIWIPGLLYFVGLLGEGCHQEKDWELTFGCKIQEMKQYTQKVIDWYEKKEQEEDDDQQKVKQQKNQHKDLKAQKRQQQPQKMEEKGLIHRIGKKQIRQRFI